MERLSEAKKFVKEGDEALKTGVFKWSKDYASAAINYDEAVKIYRAAKQYDQAIAIYEKLIAVNEKMNDSWAVARNFESIVTISVERTDGNQVPAAKLIDWTAKAGAYFRMANSVNTYLSLVKKVAKCLEERNDLVEALNLYKNLLNDLHDDEQHHLHSEVVTNYAGLLMKIQRYNECIDLFEREYNVRKSAISKSSSSSNKGLDTLALTITALNLIVGDIDRAEKRLQDFSLEIKDFIRNAEFDVSDKLIEAYNDGNQAAFDKVAQRGVLNSIFPLNIIKELRKVKVKASTKKKVMDINDFQGAPVKNTLFGDDFTGNSETNNTSNNVVQAGLTEEQRQKALDDMLC